jgi:hypothetical protein
MARLSVTADRDIEIAFHGVEADDFDVISKRFDLPSGGKAISVYLTPDGFYREEENIPARLKNTAVEVAWYAE